jgi:hypothetical protein
VLLGACASNPTAHLASPSDTFVMPDVPARAYSSISTSPEVSSDRCGAASMSWLVGRPRTEIPVTADLSNRWVQSTAAVHPPGVVPSRLTILYDPLTGRVTHVQCG